MKLHLLIIVVFFSAKAQAQIEAHYKYWDSGFCSKSIYLKLDGTFYYEQGCEGDGRICKGKYTIQDSILSFRVDTSSSGQLTYLVFQPFRIASDSVIIEVVDVNEIPLDEFRIGLLPLPQKEQRLITEMYETDKNGILKLPKNKFTHFVSQNDIELSSVLGRDYTWIEFEKNKNYYYVQFNYPYYCLKRNRVEKFSEDLISLQFTNGQLYNEKLKITYIK